MLAAEESYVYYTPDTKYMYVIQIWRFRHLSQEELLVKGYQIRNSLAVLQIVLLNEGKYFRGTA